MELNEIKRKVEQLNRRNEKRAIDQGIIQLRGIYKDIQEAILIGIKDIEAGNLSEAALEGYLINDMAGAWSEVLIDVHERMTVEAQKAPKYADFLWKIRQVLAEKDANVLKNQELYGSLINKV